MIILIKKSTTQRHSIWSS